MDDEDPIVEEIPIYLSKVLMDKLFLFQYPTRTEATNFDKADVVNCCVKPISKEVKVDFALDVDTEFFDRSKGEIIALAADGRFTAKGERPTYKHGLMDKQSYTSTRTVGEPNKYAVAIFGENEVHITPLTSVLQLRPSTSHLDKADKRQKAEQKALDQQDDDEELQQVTVKFTNAAKARVSQNKDKVDEAWCETFWHNANSDMAELERRKLFTTNRQHCEAFSQDPQKYVEDLLYVDIKNYGIDALVPARVISKIRLKDMPLLEQIKQVLKDAKMVTFDKLMYYLHDGINPTANEKRVSTLLAQVGLLLYGNWVAQSEVLYPPETRSRKNGVPAEIMARARDYVIYKFSRHTHLYRRQLLSTIQLPTEEGLEVLQSVARMNGNKKWELLLPPNTEYQKRNPEIVQRQEMVWLATEQTFREMELNRTTKRFRKRSLRELKSHKAQAKPSMPMAQTIRRLQLQPPSASQLLPPPPPVPFPQQQQQQKHPPAI